MSQTFLPDAGPCELAWFDGFQRLTTLPGNAARFQGTFGEIDMRDRLGPLGAPTIALHSKDDMRIPPDMGRALASGIPDAQVVPLVRGRRGATLPAGGSDDRA
ncbi:transcriptional regulator, CadC [Citreicella sp. SE45]|nr:transcriptional regulator, CadC [Citreicella sp. SE45]